MFRSIWPLNGRTAGLACLALVAALMLSGAATAAAATLSVDPRLAPAGASVRITGDGYGAAATVAITIGERGAGTLSAGAGGTIDARVTVPADLGPGATTVTALATPGGVSASTAFRVRSNWSQLGRGPEHAFANPFENQIGPSNAAALTRVWRGAVGAPLRTTPIVASGRVYVGSDNGDVRAFGAISGRLRWRRATGAAVDTTPAAAYGRLFVTSGDRVIALDSGTGEVLWKRTLGAELGSPAVTDGDLIVQDAGGVVTSLNAATGAVRWTRDLAASGGRPRTPTIDDDRTLVVVDGGPAGDRLLALDTPSGATRWQASVGSLLAGAGTVPSFDVADPVSVLGDRVWAALSAPVGGTTAAAWSVRGGALLERAAPAGVAGFASALALGPASPAPAVGATTGSELASIGPLLGSGPGRGPGWVSPLAGAAPHPPALAGGVAYVGAPTGLRAFAAGDGASLFSSSGVGAVTATPAVSDGRVYAASLDGSLHAFALVPGTPPQAAAPARPGAAPSRAAADRRAPRLRVRLAARQRALRRGSLTLRVTCDEPCRVTVAGSVISGGSKLRLTAVRRSLRAERATLVRVGLSRKARRRMARDLRAGARVRAALTIRASDAAGNRASRSAALRIVR